MDLNDETNVLTQHRAEVVVRGTLPLAIQQSPLSETTLAFDFGQTVLCLPIFVRFKEVL